MSDTRRAALLDWLAQGPFAIVAAALQGGMNYAIVLYLTFGSGLTATGEYRTLFSYYSLLALASMIESNKVFISSVVAEDADATTAIFANRVVFGTAAFAIVALIWGIGKAVGHAVVPDVLVVIALLAAIVYPCDLYIAALQAGRRFRRLFVVEVVKYATAFGLFVGMIASGWSVTHAVLAQLAVMGACNIGFFMVYARGWVRFGAISGYLRTMLRSPAAERARTYSFAGMLPASLENIDKLLVGQVFGLAFLGVYTLAFSTGRFLYNTLKPAMYIYYRRFVDKMPGWAVLRKVSFAFTLLGAATAGLFLIAIHLAPGLATFRAGRWATVILFLSYGIGILSAVYSQAFVLNKESIAAHALRANIIATLPSLVLLAVALTMPPATALILLVLQYPLRDGLSVLLMHRLRRAG